MTPLFCHEIEKFGNFTSLKVFSEHTHLWRFPLTPLKSSSQSHVYPLSPIQIEHSLRYCNASLLYYVLERLVFVHILKLTLIQSLVKPCVTTWRSFSSVCPRGATARNKAGYFFVVFPSGRDCAAFLLCETYTVWIGAITCYTMRRLHVMPVTDRLLGLNSTLTCAACVTVCCPMNDF